MTGLRLVAADTSLDSAGRARKRDSVLRVYRLTPTVLESAASRLAERPEHAAQLLHAIDARVAAASIRAASPPAPRPSAPAVRPPPATVPKKPSI